MTDRRKGPKIPPYYIYFYDEKIKVNPEIFAKYSSKFAEEFPSHPDGIEFTENVNRESFLAFVKASHLTNFDIPKQYLGEVMNISRVWGCPTLEAYAIKLCKEHGMYIRPRYDPVGILIEKIDKEEESVKDLIEVAKIINDAFEDDRLDDIEPELLYRIILIAEKDYTLDQEKFKNFVIPLFKTVPHTASILSLRLNFNILTQDEIETILACPVLADEGLGFFAGNNLSIVRGQCRDRLLQLENDNLNSFTENLALMDYREQLMIYELRTHHEECKARIADRLAQQKAELEDIFQILAEQAPILDIGDLSEEGLMDRDILQLTRDAQREIDGHCDHIANVLEENVDERRDMMEQAVARKLHDWTKKLTNEEDRAKLLKRSQKAVREKSGIIELAESAINEDIASIRGVIAAKIVEDRLRTDRGQRDVSRRYEIFDGEDPLNTNREEIQTGNEIIDSINKRLEDMCPIRRH